MRARQPLKLKTPNVRYSVVQSWSSVFRRYNHIAMAEGSYEYECMRAELLGVEKPDYDEFISKQQEEMKKVEAEKLVTEQLKETEHQEGELKNVSGKLDELNNLLSLTQKKINNFKYRCSSVTSYVRNRLGSNAGTSLDADLTKSEETDASDLPKQRLDEESQRKSDLSRALDNHVDKLDSLLDKSEDAHYAMTEQRKQMQRYLK